MFRLSHRAGATVIALGLLSLTATACSGKTSNDNQQGTGTGAITIWAHQGQEGERSALQDAVKGFNASQSKITATLKLIPENDYTKSLTATKPADLPDVLEFDGPNMANLVYNKKLVAVDDSISATTKSNALPSILAQGTLGGKLYGLGMFDSGLGIWGNKKLLDAAGVHYPKGLDDAWTADQFTAALAALAGKDADKKVLDIKENYGFGGGSEWTTYGFSPVVWSAGGNLIANGKADGVLNTPAVVTALTTVRDWKAYVDPNTKDDAFTSGKVALSWVGHWVYPDYQKALGADLALLPLPNFGNGVKSGQGSWAWGIGAGTKNAKAAGAFIDYLLSDANVAAMTKANGAPPGTKSAVAASALYKQGGPLQLYVDQLAKTCGSTITTACVTVPRPLTAGYPTITNQFATAFKNIYDGGSVKDNLDKAAKAIDLDFADNDGYSLS